VDSATKKWKQRKTKKYARFLVTIKNSNICLLLTTTTTTI